MHLVLASASPRRADLLLSAGLDFVQVSPAVDEHWSDIPPEDVARRLAHRKAQAVVESVSNIPTPFVVLAADTIVVMGSVVLEKPRNRDEACKMLETLSGRTHRVLTGYCILWEKGPGIERVVSTEVSFKHLHSEEIDYYLATGEWTDKAGAYGIQGAAAFMVSEVRGSYTNVVGLPLAQVLDDLRRLGKFGHLPIES